MKRPDFPDEALQEIQTLLMTAMRNIDAHMARLYGDKSLLQTTNAYMADAHLLTTWVRDSLKHRAEQ